MMYERSTPYLFATLSIAGALVMAYLVIGKETPFAFEAAFFLMVFLLCFFSVRISLVLLIFSMLLSPEIAVGSVLRRDITVRFEDILLFIMTLGWMFRIAIFKDIGLIIKSPLNWPILAYCSVAILSTAMGAMYGRVNPAMGFFFVLKMIEYFFLYKIIVNYVQTPESVHRLLTGMLVVCGLIVLYGAYQAMVGGDVAAPFEGGVGERNTLGGYLALMGAVGAGVLLHTEYPLERYIIATMLPVLIGVLAFSLSRSGWVSGLTVMGILFFHARPKHWYILGALAIIITLLLTIPEQVVNRFLWTFFQSPRPGAQVMIGSIRLDTSTSARMFSIQYVFKHFMDKPFFGHGVTGFAFVDGQFIRVISEMGVVGFGVFVWLLAEVYRLIRKAMRLELHGRLRGLVVGFHAGFWALIVHALTANTFIIVRIAEPFWCLAGLVVVLVMRHNTDHAPVSFAGASSPLSGYSMGRIGEAV